MLAKVKTDCDLGTSVEFVHLTGELIKNFRAASEALEKAIGRNRTEQG